MENDEVAEEDDIRALDEVSDSLLKRRDKECEQTHATGKAQ